MAVMGKSWIFDLCFLLLNCFFEDLLITCFYFLMLMLLIVLQMMLMMLMYNDRIFFSLDMEFRQSMCQLRLMSLCNYFYYPNYYFQNYGCISVWISNVFCLICTNMHFILYMHTYFKRILQILARKDLLNGLVSAESAAYARLYTYKGNRLRS